MTAHAMNAYAQIPQDDPPQPHRLGALGFPSISSQIEAPPHSLTAGLVSYYKPGKVPLSIIPQGLVHIAQLT